MARCSWLHGVAEPSQAGAVRRADRHAVALVASGIAAALLGYVWVLSAGHLLPVRAYADFTAAASLVYFVAIATAPVSQTVAFFTAVANREHRPLGGMIRRLERFIATIGSLVIVGVAALAVLLDKATGLWPPTLLVAIAASAVAVSLVSVRRGYLQGEMQFDRYSVNITIEGLGRLVIAFAVCWLMPTAAAAVAAYAVASLAALALLPSVPSDGSARLRPLLAYFGPALLTTVVYSAFLNFDILLVRYFFPTAEAAVYGASSFVARGVGMLVMPFYVYAIPQLAAVAHDRAEVRRRFLRICAGFGGLELLAIAGLAIVREPLVAVLLAPSYAAAASLVLPISVMVAVGGLAFIACQLPASRGDFGFLPLYAAGFIVELAAVTFWHATLLQAIAAMLASVCLTLVLVGAYVVRLFRSGARH